MRSEVEKIKHFSNSFFLEFGLFTGFFLLFLSPWNPSKRTRKIYASTSKNKNKNKSMLHSEIHTRENNVRDILLRMFTQRNLSSKQ